MSEERQNNGVSLSVRPGHHIKRFGNGILLGKCLKGPADPDSQLITLPTRVEHNMLTYVYGE
jgi:hypothetical protein